MQIYQIIREKTRSDSVKLDYLCKIFVKNTLKLTDMKKILLAISFIIAGGCILGQSLSLTYDGAAVEPNSTIYVMGDPTDDIIQVAIDVTNNASTDLSVKSKKVINEGDTLTGTSNYFCWGACYPSFVYISPAEVIIGAGQTTNEFFGDYEPREIPGKSIISYVWWDVNNPDDSVKVTVEFNASPAGLVDGSGTVSAVSRVYPNPAFEKVSIDYSLPVYNGEASIIISNILGARIMEMPLNGREGTVTLNVSDLTQGVYFYNLITGGQRIDTQKLIINN